MFSLDRWLGRSRDPVLGIDIGGAGIHLVELGAPGWPLQVRHAASEPMPQGALRDGAIVQPEALANALRQAVRASGTRLRDAALALPAGAVMKKILSLPDTLHEDDLEIEIEAEAGASLPFPREEAGIDFTVLGPTIGQPGFVDVMLVAARREQIDQRVDLALSAGLRPRIVDVESHVLAEVVGLAEAGRAADPERPVAVLQIDAERSHCLFVLGTELLHERELVQGMPRRDADACDRIRHEFDRLVQMFCASTTYPAPAHLYLLGQIPTGLPSALSQAQGIGVTVPDPLLEITGGRERISLPAQQRASAALLACGLALRSFTR